MKLEDESTLLWPVLTLAARNQRILSYAELESITGIEKRGMGEPLGLIYFYCQSKKYPALNSIVVSRETGKPGHSYPGAGDVLSEQSKVFVFDWSHQRARVPRAEDFRKFIPKLSRYKQTP